MIQGTIEVQTLSRPRSQLWVVAAPESTHDLCWNTNNLFNQNFYKWRFSVTLSVYLRDDHAFLLSSIDEYRSRVSTGYVKLINVLVSAPRLQRCLQQHIKHMSHTRCALRDLRKTWAICLIDRSLNLSSIRLLTCNVYGDRTRSTPYTTLKTARPRGKQRAEHRDFYKSLLGYCTSRSRASSKSRFNPTRPFSLGSGPLYTFWRSSPWPYLVPSGFFDVLIWMSETLLSCMIRSCFFLGMT